MLFYHVKSNVSLCVFGVVGSSILGFFCTAGICGFLSEGIGLFAKMVGLFFQGADSSGKIFFENLSQFFGFDRFGKIIVTSGSQALLPVALKCIGS